MRRRLRPRRRVPTGPEPPKTGASAGLRRSARSPPSSGSSAERACRPSPAICAFSHTGCPSGATTPSVDLRMISMSGIVACRSASHTRAEVGVIVWLGFPQPCVARGAAAGVDQARASASPHTRRRSRIASARSAMPRSRAPRPSSAARGWLARTQPAQRCGASLRHRPACGARKRASRCGACHQRWPAASRGWEFRAAPGSGRDGAAAPIARPIKDVEESLPFAADLPVPALRGHAAVAWLRGVRL